MNIFTKSFALATEALSFPINRKDIFFQHMKYFFPVYMIVVFIEQLNLVHGARSDVSLILGLLKILVLAGFSLAWHRVCLRGPHESPRSAFSLSKEVLSYYAIAVLIFIAFGIVNFGLNTVFVNLESNSENKSYAPIMAGLIAIGILYILIRLMFFLPAQSVGVTLSLKDVMRSSKSAFFPFIISSFLTCLPVIIFFVIYLFFMEIIGVFVGRDQHLSDLAAVFYGFALSLPIHLGTFFYFAAEVGILSKLYQWGMQNNE